METILSKLKALTGAGNIMWSHNIIISLLYHSWFSIIPLKLYNINPMLSSDCHCQGNGTLQNLHYYNCIIHTCSCVTTSFACFCTDCLFLMIHITTVIVLSLLYSICGALWNAEFIACSFLSRSYFLFCATTLCHPMSV